MNRPLALVDQSRFQLFATLGQHSHLFANFDQQVDRDGVAWAVRQFKGFALAVTWLGPGWVFDPYASGRRAEELREAREAMARADSERHGRELRNAAGRLRLGRRTERALWFIHDMVLAARTSVFRAPDFHIGAAVWGARRECWPRQWRQDVTKILQGLAWLHVAAVRPGEPLEFGRLTALLTHAADLRGDAADICDDGCPGRGGPKHHHYLLNIGAGLLGALEQFAQEAVGGVRTYSFPVGGARGAGPTLRSVGRTGELVTVYLPAKLGDVRVCDSLTGPQHRLLQALVRETTRRARQPGRCGSERDVLPGNMIPDALGKSCVPCALLESGIDHVGFNGNGVRRGLGYRICTAGGWLAKAGYGAHAVDSFLRDLHALGAMLSLTVVGVERQGHDFLDLGRLQAMHSSSSQRAALERVLLRVYAPSNYLERWNSAFGWAEVGQRPELESVAATLSLLEGMTRKGIGRGALARGLGADPSFLSKLLGGKKPWPAPLLARARAWVADYKTSGPPLSPPQCGVASVASTNVTAIAARRHLERGWSVVPQLPGAKKPLVRWKPYQTRLPTSAELDSWFARWPTAGLAVVLGPVSGLFVVDVDGPEAYAVLLERMGAEPVAPKALSGSRKPFRFHLYFRCPDLPTKAKATPWHPQLEFRGQGGIVVIPPSLHSSGARYEWAEGRSPDEVPLPEAPPAILAALQPPPPTPPPTAVAVPLLTAIPVVASPSTRQFLSGQFANGPGWNQRLFQAGCDLAARGVPRETAEPLLLAGARPWDCAERDAALRTIESAYNQPRAPSVV